MGETVCEGYRYLSEKSETSFLRRKIRKGLDCSDVEPAHFVIINFDK